jgi:hypothetical protein
MNAPVGSIATPVGPWPAVNGDNLTCAKAPFLALMAKAETSWEPPLVT